MFRPCAAALQKRMSASAFLASAGKVGGEEKYAQVAIEYLYEKSHHTDPRKREADIKNETKVAAAYDRYSAISEAVFQQRISRLTERSNAALEAIPHPDLLEEALLLNSEHLPLNFPRPSLTPPIPGFQCGYGVDVPQLRADVMEFPRVVRPTDKMQYGSSADTEEGGADADNGHATFPFVEVDAASEFNQQYSARIEQLHGEVRKDVPLTGASGEGWEAYVALNKKALARQKLIFDLCADEDLRERYDADEELRASMLEERGIVPLVMEDSDEVIPDRREVPPLPPLRHYAQDPKYQPIRKM